ncbi:MAG: TetR/AcrR family transcriptional regulator [Kofleriaceae bacterium]|nr:TetR/AcrR family transcriptional regulator [Kofleriaceae bacterium]MBP6839964.1 TetR/AcrR family transcriptional regulator [Kofleriaceae bacterium]
MSSRPVARAVATPSPAAAGRASAPAPTGRASDARRDATRQALLDAAVSSLIELGVARTTTLEVQKRAGMSRGALLHHFPTKAELVAATIGYLGEMRGRELKDAAATLPTGPARVDAVLDLLWQSFTGPLFYVAMELRTAARTDRELRAVLLPIELALRERIVAQYAALLGPAISSRPGFARAIDLTLHLMIGAAMTALLHDEQRDQVDDLIAHWKATFKQQLGLTTTPTR